jgi:hypothetical protein
VAHRDRWRDEPGRRFLVVMDAIERGEIATLVIAHTDRLARLGFDYLEHGAEKNDCGIVVANRRSLSPDQELFKIFWRWCAPFPAACRGWADTKRRSRASWARVAGEGHPCRVLAGSQRGQVRSVGGAGSPVGAGAVVGVGPVRVDHGCWPVRPADPRWVDGAGHRHVVRGVGPTGGKRPCGMRWPTSGRTGKAKATVGQRVGHRLVPEAERKRLSRC